MPEHCLAGRVLQRLPAAAVSLLAAKARAARAEAPDLGAACRLGDASCAVAHAASVSRAVSGRDTLLFRSILGIQRQYGNRFVGQVLRQAGGAEHDGGGLDTIERSIEGARGAGQGMDHGTRARMESAFGADFSGVRIHTDARADELSQSLHARAFTTGSDVFFRAGEYNPGDSSGRELLAHELTHVVQQGGGEIRRRMAVSQPDDPHEVEAERTARSVIQQEHSPPTYRFMIASERDEQPLAARLSSGALLRQSDTLKPEEEGDKKRV